MKCSKCGFENKDSSRFCLKCGNKLIEDTPLKQESDDIAKAVETVNEAKESDKSEAIPKINSDSVDEKAITGSQNKKTMIIVALSITAVLMLSVAVSLAVTNDAEPASVEMSVTDTTETIQTTAVETEKVTEASTKKTAKTTKKTSATTKKTTVTTTSATTTETTTTEVITTPPKSNEAHFTLSCGTIDCYDNNEHYRINDGYGDYYISYYQLDPYVNITNEEVSAKIQNTLSKMLKISEKDDGFGNNVEDIGERVDSVPAVYGNMEFEHRIDSVYEENGLIFVSIFDYTDMGGNSYSSRFYSYKTCIFDSYTGEYYKLTQLIRDKDGFNNAVGNYVYGMTCDELSTSVDYNEYLSKLYVNNWNDGDWFYDGVNLTVNYHFLLGWEAIYDNTTIDVPVSVWKDYVNFSAKGISEKETKAVNVDDEFKIDYTTWGYPEQDYSDWDGLYWVFSDGYENHYLWEISELAVKYSDGISAEWTVDDYYEYLNTNWTRYCDCWYFDSNANNDFVIGSVGQYHYTEYARIPYKEFMAYLNPDERLIRSLSHRL